MNSQNKVAGVVLAGGMGRRMDWQDKGLVEFRGRPLVSYALTALRPLVDDLMISINRNADQYQLFGQRLIEDGNQHFDGPLAGINAALQNCEADILLVLPCDSPLVESTHLQHLLTALLDHVDIAVANDGERLHPTVAALRTALQPSLQRYLADGHRKLQSWFELHRVACVDFSAEPAIFANINTLTELVNLEKAQSR